MEVIVTCLPEDRCGIGFSIEGVGSDVGVTVGSAGEGGSATVVLDSSIPVRVGSGGTGLLKGSPESGVVFWGLQLERIRAVQGFSSGPFRHE
jgi:hypothetical protein